MLSLFITKIKEKHGCQHICFKNGSTKNSPYYQNQRKAWMSTDLFKKWFHENSPCVERFLSEKGLPRKAISLIDNVPTHPKNVESGYICTYFLPSSVAALVQPLDQGVLETVKRHYLRFLLRSLLQEFNESKA